MSEVAAQSEKARPRRFRPYPEYRDSGVEWLGEIPAHWEVKRLKTLASVQLSNVDKHSEESQVPVTLCNYVDVYYNDLITADLEFMSATATPEQVRRFLLRAGDVLITKDSESWNDIAVPTVVAEDLTDVLCGYYLAQITPGQGLDGRFLARQFSAIGTRDQFHIAAKGITRFGLGGDAIRTGLFPIAPMEEQRAIADFLDRETAKIDALVARKERLVELLREKRTALITRAVTQGLAPNVPMKDSGVEWLGEIPKHWEAGALSRWWTVLDCKHRTVPFLDEGIAVASIGEVHGLKVDLSDANRTSVEEYENMIEGGREPRIGDIIYSRNATVGEAAIVDNDEPFCMGQDVSLIRSVSEQPLFLLHTLRSRVVLAQLETLMVGSTFKRINVGQIKKFFVVVPPRSAQEDIAHYAADVYGAISSLIGRVREAIDILKEFRTALISAAVTGKIDVREASPQ